MTIFDGGEREVKIYSNDAVGRGWVWFTQRGMMVKIERLDSDAQPAEFDAMDVSPSDFAALKAKGLIWNCEAVRT